MAKRRTTISVDGEIFKAGLKRAKELRYDSISEYIEHLVGADAKERPAHIVIRGTSSATNGGEGLVLRETISPKQAKELGVSYPGESRKQPKAKAKQQS